MKYVLSLLLLFGLGNQSFCQPNLEQPFKDCGIPGSITIFDYNSNKWTMSDSVDTRMETPPGLHLQDHQPADCAGNRRD